jgi:hypothetical protein
MMKGTPAIYLGRIVDKKHFRAFIHAPDGAKRLVESWDEFEANMQSGVWFATPEDAKASLDVIKPKAKRASRAKKVEFNKPEVLEEPADEDEEEDAPEEDLAFEVKDDFLPKG